MEERLGNAVIAGRIHANVGGERLGGFAVGALRGDAASKAELVAAARAGEVAVYKFKACATVGAEFHIGIEFSSLLALEAGQKFGLTVGKERLDVSNAELFTRHGFEQGKVAGGAENGVLVFFEFFLAKWAVELGFGAVVMPVVLECECRLEILVPDNLGAELCAFLGQESADDFGCAVVEEFRDFFVGHDVACDGLVKDKIASRSGIWRERWVAIFVVRSRDVAPFADKAVPGI